MSKVQRPKSRIASGRWTLDIGLWTQFLGFVYFSAPLEQWADYAGHWPNVVAARRIAGRAVNNLKRNSIALVSMQDGCGKMRHDRDMAHQTSLGQQIAGNPDSARIGCAW